MSGRFIDRAEVRIKFVVGLLDTIGLSQTSIPRY